MPAEPNSIASYFGVAAEIAQLVPELLVDFYDLGAFPEQIVALLRQHGLKPGARVLDLGCGKGAVALALAGQLQARVEGVDLMPAFMEEARARAERMGLSRSCRFTCEDISELLAQPDDSWDEPFDVALLLSVGEVLGDPRQTVGALRQVVCEGGHIVIDDGFFKEGVTVDFPGYQQQLNHRQSIEQLTAHGDRIIAEQLIPLEQTKEQNRRYMGWIERRARELTARHPEHTAAFAAYVERERAEVRLLENDFVCATWLLERI